jgi:hypothetical protein
MAVLFFTKVGFWFVAAIYSLFWGLLWALIAGALSNENGFWNGQLALLHASAQYFCI